MAKRHGRWTPSLHPRGKNGEFSGKGGSSAERKATKAARKTGRQSSSVKAKTERRQDVRAHNVRAAIGVGVGISTIAAGHATGSKARVGAGVARIGLAGVERHVNVKDAKFRTSKDFEKLNNSEKAAYRKKSLNRRRATGLAGVGLDAGLVLSNKVARANATQRINTLQHMDKSHASFLKEENSFQRKWGSLDDQINPYRKYQGPGSHRTVKAGKRGSSAGVYNITNPNRPRWKQPRKAKNVTKISKAKKRR